MSAKTEIRDPIHGFIELNPWEKEIIDDPIFQRLRRIRQLGLTDMIYPGAMHTRFEHSLGVMYVATKMFDHIANNRKDFLVDRLNFNDDEIRKDRVILRLACLLHDIGHPPFSHAGEGLMPLNMEKSDKGKAKPYKHELYSMRIIQLLLDERINGNPLNDLGVTTDEISGFLNRDPKIGKRMIWTDLISGQIDADRADYLLRDSYHLGVAYGHYDLNRLISTLTIVFDEELGSPRIAVEEGGEHAAEALIIARYMMFTQVYFHKTRRVYDFHITKAIKELLLKMQSDSTYEVKYSFPPPTEKKNLEDYLKWDDWCVSGLIFNGQAGEHGRLILNRQHYRSVFETPDTTIEADLELLEEVKGSLGDEIYIDKSSKSWYEVGETGDKEIKILLRPGKQDEELTTLSNISNVAKDLTRNTLRFRVYVPIEQREEAIQSIERIRKRRSKEYGH